MKLAIFIPNWIGDAAMSTPALRALRKHVGPQGSITGILRPYVEDVLAGTPWLDERIYYHPHARDEAMGTRAVLAEMKLRQFDAVAILTNSFRSAMLAWRAGVPKRVGYVRYGRGPLLTHRLYYPRQQRGWRSDWLPTGAIQSYLQIAYTLGCEIEPPQIEMATLAADEAAADAAWNRLRLPSGDSVVVLNSGGAYGVAKHWPAEYFAALARRIVSELGLTVLINCGPAERDSARQMVAAADHPRVVSLADEPVSVGLSKAVIRRSRLVVTTDSGPRFFAAAFGVPMVSLFGPTDPRWAQTHAARETRLQHEVPCGPCAQRKCPVGHHDCMRQLGVDRVFAAVRMQLDSRRQLQVA